MFFSISSFLVPRVGRCGRARVRSGHLGDPPPPVLILRFAASIAASLFGKRFHDCWKSILRWTGDLYGEGDLCGAGCMGVVFGFFLGACSDCSHGKTWVSRYDRGGGPERRFQQGFGGGLQPAGAAAFHGLLGQKPESSEAAVQLCPIDGRSLR